MDMDTETNQKVTRQAEYAGKFYSGSAKELKAEVEKYCREGKPPLFPQRFPGALIVPHAGYVFSGKVAASGYNQMIPGHYPERVFILASSHQYAKSGVSVFSSGNYETPLGPVRVDTATAKELLTANDLFNDREEIHRREHSLEVQLPFLQHKLGNHLRVVPLVLGIRHPGDCLRLAEALQPWFNGKNLFVISSDFSHYPDYQNAQTTDKATSEAILSNSPEQLLKTLDHNSKLNIPGLATSLCGWTSVLTLLYLTAGKTFSYHWADYQNSGDQPLFGDHHRVVGYSSIAVYEEQNSTFSLTEPEKMKLLELADRALRKFIVTGSREKEAFETCSGKLLEKGGAFVSIYIGGKLRGCIGRFENGDSLADAVHDSAVSAATDRRFSPVSPEELNDLTIEISVLSPLRKISSPEEIEPGRHGIYIRKDWSSGTFLPQVADKYGWTTRELLERCARDKAGIGKEGWKTAELFVYEAIVFSNAHS